MENIFINALVSRAKIEDKLIDQLPDDIRGLVLEKLSEVDTENNASQTDIGE